MTGPEATLERRCVKAARAAGGDLIKILPWAVRGLPDRLLVLPGGVTVWVEFKAPTGRLTPLQEYWQGWLTEREHHHEVVSDWEGFQSLLSKFA